MNEILINSFKLEAADKGRFLKLDENGRLISADITPKSLQVLSHDDHALIFSASALSALEYQEYSIAGFNGPNIINANITNVIVRYYLYSKGSALTHHSKFYATYPWGEELVGSTHGTYASSSYRSIATTGTAIIPINKNQASISCGIYDGSNSLGTCTYEIIGVIQSG